MIKEDSGYIIAQRWLTDDFTGCQSQLKMMGVIWSPGDGIDFILSMHTTVVSYAFCSVYSELGLLASSCQHLLQVTLSAPEISIVAKQFYDSAYILPLKWPMLCRLGRLTVSLTSLLQYCLHRSNMGAVVYSFLSGWANLFFTTDNANMILLRKKVTLVQRRKDYTIIRTVL